MRGTPITRTPVHRRNIGMLFQSYALFPHMTVLQNVGFGLRMRRLAVPATNRASFSIYNTPGEVDVLVEALNHVVEVFSDGDRRAAV